MFRGTFLYLVGSHLQGFLIASGKSPHRSSFRGELIFFLIFLPLGPASEDSKQNGDANVVLSDEEQPLSPSNEEKKPMRRSSTRDKNKKAATCFLLTAGDFSCAADGGIRKGMGEA